MPATIDRLLATIILAASPRTASRNVSQASDLYVDGVATEPFLAAIGLELDMGKGDFVFSKRLSRLLRPYFVSGFFDPGAVTVGYLEQTPAEAKVWDGAGLIRLSIDFTKKATISSC
jgi:hypothetical protein